MNEHLAQNTAEKYLISNCRNIIAEQTTIIDALK